MMMVPEESLRAPRMRMRMRRCASGLYVPEERRLAPPPPPPPQSQFPFSFWKPSGPGPAPFDPATINATLWHRGSFSIPPLNPGGGPYEYWSGTPSAGTSGAKIQSNNTGSNDPVSGATLNGFLAGRYGNTGKTTTTNSAFAATDIASVISPTAYTVMGLVRVNSASAYNSGTPYANGTIIQGDARWGIYVTSAPSLGVWHFNGAFPDVHVTTPAIGTWFFFCVRWDSVSGNVQADINTTAGTPTALPAFAALAGVNCTLGFGPFSSAVWSNDDEELLATQARETDVTRDHYYAYLKWRYPAAGLP